LDIPGLTACVSIVLLFFLSLEDFEASSAAAASSGGAQFVGKVLGAVAAALGFPPDQVLYLSGRLFGRVTDCGLSLLVLEEDVDSLRECLESTLFLSDSSRDFFFLLLVVLFP